MTNPIVYFTKKITPDSLLEIYKKLDNKLKGRIGIKVSTSEPGGHNYLKPELIGKLVKELNTNIIEYNTAYPGRRNTLAKHLKTVEKYGFNKITKVNLMDSEGEIEIPTGGNNIITPEREIDSWIASWK